MTGEKTQVYGIIPACAGSTRPNLDCPRLWGDHPRMYGEHDNQQPDAYRPVGSSPHVRGARHHLHKIATRHGIIPACAGSTFNASFGALQNRDHPRMCGEHAETWIQSSLPQGSSPHVRGAQPVVRAEHIVGGIIPACAGSTPRNLLLVSAPWDHPRMCGEHATPRTDTPDSTGIIPACAGSTSVCFLGKFLVGDHPRMCGEHFNCEEVALMRVGSSPHVRGAHLDRRLPRRESGIIPACAGSTVT